VAPLLMALGAASSLASDPPTGPELKEGDMVALIGGGFIEREGLYGYIETALTARYADRDIKFRNLGWSGDTVWCESRAYFGTPEDGFKHLLEHVDLVKPTVIILNYGANEAFAGETGLPKFIEGYNRLLDELEKRTKRIVLLSPTPMEPRPHLPDLLWPNHWRKHYSRAIQRLATERSHQFIDLFRIFIADSTDDSPNNTEDGFQLNLNGHHNVASQLYDAFRGGLDELWVPGFTHKHLLFTPDSVADQERFDNLRRAIITKNALFFHRHRPQNETYLRGFRKHEQGNNAVEIFEFEKLVAEKEREISRLRGELLKALQAKEGDR
jgi:lysophospholipase L1-like esterase